MKKRSRDRMSDLPDSILHHIFSFLSTQHAVRSSVLSKRFRNLWKSLPYLNFDDYERLDFVKFVNKVLIQRHKSDILRFRIECGNVVAEDIWSWIIAATQSNLQVMDFHVERITKGYPPSCLYSCNSLTFLRLSFGPTLEEIRLPPSGLPNLKVFYCRHCYLPYPAKTIKFISSCYSLESLELDEDLIESENPYVISNAKLESLVIKGVYFGGSMTKVQICAPNLRAFACYDELEVAFSFVVPPPLRFADIDVNISRVLKDPTTDDNEKLDCVLLMTRLLSSAHSVRTLKLSGKVLEVAFERSDVLQLQSLQFCNMKCLHLRTWLSRDCILAMLEFMRISPKIETLVLHKIKNTDGCSKPINWEGISANIDATEHCPFHRLKVLQIHGVIGCKNELKLLEIFLKNVTTLEKINIWTFRKISSDRRKRLISFSKTLMRIPRASPNIGIFFF